MFDVGIISSLDSQSFLLTRKLLERNASPLLGKLRESHPSDYPIEEITVELELETINGVIDELMKIGEEWLNDSDHEFHNERRQILAYVLQQWINIGQDAEKLTDLPTNQLLH